MVSRPPPKVQVTGRFLKQAALWAEKNGYMSDSQNWAEALNISPENLSLWSANAPDGEPLLVWCLEQGHIEVESYLNWAQTNLELPILDSRFFSEGLDASLLDEAQKSSLWHPWLFPVEKWEEVTIIACVELPREESDKDFRYVLADPRAMRQAWQNASAKSDFDAPIGIGKGPTVPFVLNLDAPVNVEEAPQPVGVTSKSNDTIDELFKTLSDRFHASLILKCANNQAKFLHWDQSFKKIQANFSIDLNTPSFLRIVYKTGMPYHGYLMDSPAHQEIFRNLGLSSIPECVTAVPIKRAEVIWGILVAFGSEENQKLEFLSFAEKATAHMVSALGAEGLKAS